MVNEEKNQTKTKPKNTLYPLHSANKHQSAEVRVATAPDENTLLASQFEHRFPNSHIMYTIVSK